MNKDDFADRNAWRRAQRDQEFENGVSDFKSRFNSLDDALNQQQSGFSDSWGSGNPDFPNWGSNSGGGGDSWSSGSTGGDWSTNFGNGGLSTAPQNPQFDNNQQQPPIGKTASEALLDMAKVGGANIWQFLRNVTPYAKRIGKDKLLKKKMLTRWVLYSGSLMVTQWVLTIATGGVLNEALWVSGFFGVASVGVWTGFTVLNFEDLYGDNTSETQAEEEATDIFPKSDEWGNNNDFSTPSTEQDPFSKYDTSDFESDWGSSSSSSSWGSSLEDEDDFDDDDFSSSDSGFGNWGSSVEDFDFDAEESFVSFDSFSDGNNSFTPVLTEVTEDTRREAEAKFDGLDSSLVQRRLLLDTYLSLLDSGGIKANEFEVIDVNTRKGDLLLAGIHQAQKALRMDEDTEFVLLEEAINRLAVWELKTTRNGLQEGQISRIQDEYNKILKYEDLSEFGFGENSYATMEGVGDTIRISIFKTKPAVVYLKDVIEQNRPFFEDENNVMPVTFGFNERGEAILLDMADSTSMILAGEGRSGKSNLGKVIVDQLVALRSPEEVNFLFGDVKGLNSDWMHLKTPHVKRFEYTTKSIAEMLEWVVQYEAPRRQRIISSIDGALNIKTYNKYTKTEKLPFMYIVLDEMLSYSERATKEELASYKSSLGIIVSEFPALGIFIIAVPHRLVNNIIPKTISKLIPTKLAVKFSTPDLKDLFGEDAKDFNYELNTQGDYGYTAINSKRLKYGHAPLLMSDDIAVQRLYESQRVIWSKLFPDLVADSYWGKKQEAQQVNERLTKIGLDNEEWLDKYL